jgi:2-iminobutanoate/2-iminopropanoate deaminase
MLCSGLPKAQQFSAKRGIMTKQRVHSEQAPAAIGPYSQAIAAGGMLFCSGQIALDPKTGSMVPGGVEAQTIQVMKNLGAVLTAAGINFEQVVKTTIYLSDLNDFQAVNTIYAKSFTAIAPARATVEVSALPKGALVEIDAIAHMEESQ